MTDSPEAEILRLEAQRLHAITTGQLDGMADLFSEDFIQVHANGRVDDKAGNLARETGARCRIDPRNPTVRAFGNVGILTGELVYRTGDGDAEIANRLIVTQVVAKEDDGKWRFISVHATKIETCAFSLPGKHD
jgi:ketosteroid isomerase-like protein